MPTAHFIDISNRHVSLNHWMIENVEPASALEQSYQCVMELKQHIKCPLFNKTQDLNIFSLVTNSDYNTVTALKVSRCSKKARLMLLV